MKPSAQEFIAAVHRRMILIRLLECLGKGCFAGCVFAVVLIEIAIWRSMAPGPVLIFCICIGVVIGGGLALLRRPTRLTAAAEADRQLRLDDLLTTALLSADNETSDFGQAVLAMADAKCITHSPSDVLLRQLGVRGWTGIGLTLAVAVTLAVIPMGASNSSASDSAISILSGRSAEPSQNSNEFSQNQPVLPRNLDPMNEAQSINRTMTEQLATRTAAQSHASSSKSNPGIAGGAGGGSKTTDAPGIKSANAVLSSHSPSTGDIIAGGGNSSSGNHTQNGETGVGTLSGGSTAQAQASISSGGDPTTVPPAQQSVSVQDNRVPAEDRDLLREFFNAR